MYSIHLKSKLFAVSLLFPMALFLLAACTNNSESATTVYLIRHAEKDLTDTTDNPPLTEEGRLRASNLVEVLENVKIDGIYSTAFDRNMNTVNPFAEKNSLSIQNYTWYEWQPMLDEIKKTSGQTFVICGHGDNLLPMIDYLGGKAPVDSLGKHEYDKIFKVVVENDTTLVETITY